MADEVDRLPHVNLFVAGYHLLAAESPYWLYLFEVFGSLLAVVTVAVFMGYLGLRVGVSVSERWIES